MNPLPTAADNGNFEEVENLLKNGNPSQADKDLALGRACCSGHLSIADLLFEKGADPNGQYETAPGEFQYGPIILASCEFLYPEGIEWLLNHGADPNGNPPDSEYFQAHTPLEMVRVTYSKNVSHRSRCAELLIAAGGIPENGEGKHDA